MIKKNFRNINFLFLISAICNNIYCMESNRDIIKQERQQKKNALLQTQIQSGLIEKLHTLHTKYEPFKQIYTTSSNNITPASQKLTPGKVDQFGMGGITFGNETINSKTTIRFAQFMSNSLDNVKPDTIILPGAGKGSFISAPMLALYAQKQATGRKINIVFTDVIPELFEDYKKKLAQAYPDYQEKINLINGGKWNIFQNEEGNKQFKDQLLNQIPANQRNNIMVLEENTLHFFTEGRRDNYVESYIKNNDHLRNQQFQSLKEKNKAHENLIQKALDEEKTKKYTVEQGLKNFIAFDPKSISAASFNSIIGNLVSRNFARANNITTSGQITESSKTTPDQNVLQALSQVAASANKELAKKQLEQMVKENYYFTESKQINQSISSSLYPRDMFCSQNSLDELIKNGYTQVRIAIFLDHGQGLPYAKRVYFKDIQINKDTQLKDLQIHPFEVILESCSDMAEFKEVIDNLKNEQINEERYDTIINYQIRK